ncbi:hypothetical protein [Ligilactobacillus ruminis]|uniref:hypothetical protein n=1 Tax=Ligilactobacillus ruminis TaxID=1623 RepID=UPI001F169DA6|nr:hypothetical protein [Ligilactobacillus ruminis]MCR5749023.1 hypothetical protein [Lactobacillus sp.]
MSTRRLTRKRSDAKRNWQVINKRKEQNQQVDIHSLLIVDKLVIKSVERAKKATFKKKETVDNFRNIVDKSKSFTGSDLFTGDSA